MATRSAIEWTESTWNPVTGCDKISPGCKHCYAHRMAKRLKAMKNPRYQNGFQVTLHEDLIGMPLRLKKPRTFFVNSMSDLLHKNVPFEFILRLFESMNQASQHTFQILTKRSERLASLSPQLPWSPNIWMGVSVENDDYTFRIDHLRDTDAAVKFLSLELLLGPLDHLNLTGIDWIIVGGESGPGARPMDSTWVRNIRDQCLAGNTPFFFKQWGGTNKKKAGRTLDGQIWGEMPKLTKPEYNQK